MTEAQANGPAGRRFENLGKRMDRQINTAIPKVEEEIRKAISYLNDEVVPRLRQDSSQALHAAAEQLRKIASHLEESGRRSSN